MKVYNDFLIFLFLVLGGVLLEEVAQILYFRLTKKKFKEHHFYYSRYIYLLIFPMLAVYVTAQRTSPKVFMVFFSFALIGTFLEGFIGLFYHKIVGQRLWTYHRYSFWGYTSLLSIPLWGMGGVLFWLLARVFL